MPTHSPAHPPDHSLTAIPEPSLCLAYPGLQPRGQAGCPLTGRASWPGQQEVSDFRTAGKGCKSGGVGNGW